VIVKKNAPRKFQYLNLGRGSLTCQWNYRRRPFVWLMRPMESTSWIKMLLRRSRRCWTRTKPWWTSAEGGTSLPERASPLQLLTKPSGSSSSTCSKMRCTSLSWFSRPSEVVCRRPRRALGRPLLWLASRSSFAVDSLSAVARTDASWLNAAKRRIQRSVLSAQRSRLTHKSNRNVSSLSNKYWQN